MNEHERTGHGADEVVARLRAADPARGARIDLPSLRAAVDARRGPEVTATSDGLVVVDELAARRGLRMSSWPARAARVAAGILLVGGGGYAIGLGAGSAVVADAPADTGETTAETTAEEAVLPEIALPSGPASDLGTSDDMTSSEREFSDGSMGAGAPWGYWQHTVFTAAGLATEGGTAEAFGLDATGVVSADRLAAIAAVFGVLGEVTADESYWSVGPQDGSGTNVGVYVAGDASLNYYDPTTDPWSCPIWTETATPEELAAPCTQRDLGPLPAVEDAIARAQQIHSDLGLNPADYTYSIADWSDGTYLHVDASRTLGGVAVDQHWTFSFTGAGLQSAYGSLANLVSLGQYPVISPTEAVARFSDPRFGGQWAGPIDTLAGSPLRAAMAEPDNVAVPAPRVPTPGMSIAWPVSEVTITSAELTLSSQYQYDNTVLVVPTYRLYSDDGGVWTMIAVADSALDFTDGT